MDKSAQQFAVIFLFKNFQMLHGKAGVSYSIHCDVFAYFELPDVLTGNILVGAYINDFKKVVSLLAVQSCGFGNYTTGNQRFPKANFVRDQHAVLSACEKLVNPFDSGLLKVF